MNKPKNKNFKNYNNKKGNKPSARREVVTESIEATRKAIISLDLEAEFMQEWIDDKNFKMHPDQKAMFEEELKRINAQKNTLTRKLDFFKRKRNEAIVNKQMRDYEAFPKEMSLDNMEKVK